MPLRNPFEYEAANNLRDSMVAEYYVDDHNYSRFLQSRRNVYLVGERGSGKTMALLFNSHRIQRLVAEKNRIPATLKSVGIYVPCNTPLTYKPEFELLDDFLSSALSEHLFVLSIAHAIVATLADVPNVLAGSNEDQLRAEVSTVLAAVLEAQFTFLDSIRVFLEVQIRETQRTALSRDLGKYHKETFSFASLVMPLLGIFGRSISRLRESHYNLLIDDSQALNKWQRRALNSWVAFRDHSLFSFKIATTNVAGGAKPTATGGSILEGHDYTRLELEQSLHNPHTNFYKLAREIVARRLKDIGIAVSPEDFFPVNSRMEKDLEKARAEVRKFAMKTLGLKENKAINDFVYKNARAHYFSNRPRKANLPAYSGFAMLVYISTGVVRNLLEPCYWMFDKAVSLAHSVEGDVPPSVISSTIQTEIILESSKQAWHRLKERLPSSIEGCSNKQGNQAHQLVDALAVHFRQRLLGSGSERGAISFTISRSKSKSMQKLTPVLDILQRAQLLYVRIGPSKDKGRRETYYVPNRILWPYRGLDPHGQHARVSLTADDLWRATSTGSLPEPKLRSDVNEGFSKSQPELWTDE